MNEHRHDWYLTDGYSAAMGHVESWLQCPCGAKRDVGTCGATIPDDPRYAGLACGLDPEHDGSHDAPRTDGTSVTWREVLMVPVFRRTGELRMPMTFLDRPVRDDSDPGYRRSMRDAGRGGLLR